MLRVCSKKQTITLSEKLKRKGVFKTPVLDAADLSDDYYYGEFNNKICQGKYERGTNQFYRDASLACGGSLANAQPYSR